MKGGKTFFHSDSWISILFEFFHEKQILLSHEMEVKKENENERERLREMKTILTLADFEFVNSSMKKWKKWENLFHHD